MKYFTPKGG